MYVLPYRPIRPPFGQILRKMSAKFSEVSPRYVKIHKVTFCSFKNDFLNECSIHCGSPDTKIFAPPFFFYTNRILESRDGRIRCNFWYSTLPGRDMDPQSAVLDIFAFFRSHHFFRTFSILILRHLKISRNGKLYSRATEWGYRTHIKLFPFSYNMCTVYAI